VLKTYLSKVAVHFVQLLINWNRHFNTFIIKFGLPLLFNSDRYLVAKQVPLIQCHQIGLKLLSRELMHVADLTRQSLQIVHNGIEHKDDLAENASKCEYQTTSIQLSSLHQRVILVEIADIHDLEVCFELFANCLLNNGRHDVLLQIVNTQFFTEFCALFAPLDRVLLKLKLDPLFLINFFFTTLYFLQDGLFVGVSMLAANFRQTIVQKLCCVIEVIDR
jgi:hypothetical protein